MSDFPTYDPEGQCPKCSSGDLGTEWKESMRKPMATRNYFGLSAHEHMERWCKRCGYKWAEAPLDVEE